jgi:uncharacterized protein (TIGR03086 family)
LSTQFRAPSVDRSGADHPPCVYQWLRRPLASVRRDATAPERTDMATRPGSAIVSLPSDTEILIVRCFEAPRELVWHFVTTAHHLLSWWGPEWCPLVECAVDLRPGGSWRYTARDDGGTEHVWSGVYRDISAPGRIVSTEAYGGYPGAESLNTVTLTEDGGLTTLRTVVQHRARELRDGHVESGMEAGMQSTFDRLDALLAAAESPRGRLARAGGDFDARVHAVPTDAWDRPSPCAGWVARDIVAHLVEWIPAVLGGAGIVFPDALDAAADPVAAWDGLYATLRASLDDPAVAGRAFDVGPPGRMTVEQAIDMLVVGDVLVHTWDLARATGLDEHLDPGLTAGRWMSQPMPTCRPG